MANFIDFDEGWNHALANGLPATLYFELVDQDVDTMAVADTLASRTQTSGTATKSASRPAASGRALSIDLSASPWTEVSGSPKAVRMMSSARGGGGRVYCAWNINGGAAVDLASVAPLEIDALSFKLAYQSEP